MNWRMLGAALAATLFLAACAASSKSGTSGAPTSFEPPPSNYVHLAKAAGATPTGDTLVIGVDSHSELEENDGAIALGFQLSYALAVRDIHAVALETSGSGLSVADPIRIASTEDEQRDALNVMAQRHPDWIPVIAHLFRGPRRNYVMLVEFTSPAGMTPLYFEMTEWAKGWTPL